VHDAIRRIVDYPEVWAEAAPGIRRRLVRRFPYGALHAVHRDQIVILAVMHLRRRPGCRRDRAEHRAGDAGRGMAVVTIELPELPKATAIGIARGKGGISFRWPRRSRADLTRLFVSWFAMLAGIAGAFGVDSAGRKDLVPVVFFPSQLVAAAGMLWHWFGKPRVRTLILRDDSLTFVAPPAHVFPSPGWLRFGFRSDFASWGKAEWKAERNALRKRRRSTVPRRDPVRVDDLGTARGLSVRSGGKGVRIGSSLRDEDREWLAEAIRLWAASAPASTEDPSGLTAPQGP
jgi:hypothetical protein